MKNWSRFQIGKHCGMVEKISKVDMVIIKCDWSNLPRVDPPMRAAEGMWAFSLRSNKGEPVLP